MSIYRESDPMPEHRTQFAVKGEKEPITKVKISNIAYQNQHTDIEIPHGSKAYAIVPCTIKTTNNLYIVSADKTRSNFKNVGRALERKKMLMLGSQDIYTTNKAEIYDTHEDSYFSKKDREEKLLQGIQPANNLKAQVSAKTIAGAAITFTTQEQWLQRLLIKGSKYLQIFTFLRILCILMN